MRHTIISIKLAFMLVFTSLYSNAELIKVPLTVAQVSSFSKEANANKENWKTVYFGKNKSVIKPQNRIKLMLASNAEIKRVFTYAVDRVSKHNVEPDIGFTAQDFFLAESEIHLLNDEILTVMGDWMKKPITESWYRDTNTSFGDIAELVKNSNKKNGNGNGYGHCKDKNNGKGHGKGKGKGKGKGHDKYGGDNCPSDSGDFTVDEGQYFADVPAPSSAILFALGLAGFLSRKVRFSPLR
jgi:hypothetical protein